MIRLGLCCIFKDQPISFRRTTARFLSGLPARDRRRRLSDICLSNADSLKKSLEYCHAAGIGDFRVNSQILPLKTHPDVGYDIADLPDAEQIVKAFKSCGTFAKIHHIRTTFHPDQFIILSSPDPTVVARSIADLNYQAQVAGWVHADVINIHAGGVYGDKTSALARLMNTIRGLAPAVRKRLTLENDDISYSPADLLPVCEKMKIPLVYDVHHHRCLPDGLTVEEATGRAIRTWNREPLFHVSSPKNGWRSADIRPHHDFINWKDFPASWLALDLTVEVEAKAKELAVLKLKKDLRKRYPG
ncbi:MAG: UV DNA damage repair endonuclease UvsE [Thermodesulfobacteriota bacterium]